MNVILSENPSVLYKQNPLISRQGDLSTVGLILPVLDPIRSQPHACVLPVDEAF